MEAFSKSLNKVGRATPTCAALPAIASRTCPRSWMPGLLFLPTNGASSRNKKPDAKTRPEPGSRTAPVCLISRTRKRNSTGKSRARNRDFLLNLGAEGWGFAGRKICLPRPDNTNPHSPLGRRSPYLLPPLPNHRVADDRNSGCRSTLTIYFDAEADGELGNALAAALVKRRGGYDVTLASGTLCPHCSRSLRVTAVRHIDESGFDIICESCHADIIRAERR